MVTVFLVTLGCPKNEVDSAGMAALLQQAGYTLVEQPEQADLLIVNTCGFIAPAREESLATLEELARGKDPRQTLVAAGCMAGLYKELLEGIDGVDALLDTNRWPEIVQLASQLVDRERTAAPAVPLPEAGLSSRCGGSAYLKIADGCDAHCTFCTIPKIKGPYRSVPREALRSQARSLVEAGVQEIVLVAQDTTRYGHDRGEPDGLPALIVDLLAAVPQLPWLRVMYTYPGHISDRLIEVMASHPQVCPYLDIPLQHAHPATLRRMGRPADLDVTRALLRRLRQGIPDLVLRSTFIVGFPGETEEEFAALRDWILEQAFERVGVFAYCHEDQAPSFWLPHPVPEQVALWRREELMALQQEIAQQWGRRQVGRTVEMLVEGIGEEGLVVGRTRWDAPEVDGLVLAQAAGRPRKRIRTGTLVPVRIMAASAYDLWGELAPSS